MGDDASTEAKRWVYSNEKRCHGGGGNFSLIEVCRGKFWSSDRKSRRFSYLSYENNVSTFRYVMLVCFYANPIFARHQITHNSLFYYYFLTFLLISKRSLSTMANNAQRSQERASRCSGCASTLLRKDEELMEADSEIVQQTEAHCCISTNHLQ